MIRNKAKNQLLILALVVGFFVGIIYENMVGSISIFQTETLQLFQEMKIDRIDYLFYVLKMRLYPVLCMVLLWNLKWRKVVINFLVIWCGFFAGRLLVSAILLQGVQGIGLCIAVLFPHMLFYALAYLILLVHLYNDRRRQWNKVKTMVLLLFFGLGVACEVYVNPYIVKCVIRFTGM